MAFPVTFWFEASQFGICLLVPVLLLYICKILKKQEYNGRGGDGNLKIIPVPPKLPIIGHLHLLKGKPFVEMTKLAERFGEIYFLQLGTIDTVVVSSYRLIKQILDDKNGDFGDRCNFLRYHILFGGDKENSLAFCNWSQVQKTRRALARRFCHSSIYSDLADSALHKASHWFSKQLHSKLMGGEGPLSNLKQLINQASANAFFGFFCGQTFEDSADEEFAKTVRHFDDIFYEINQSHPTDVFPILSPLFRGQWKTLSGMGIAIREFVTNRIINPHLEKLDIDNPEDFVDILLIHLTEAEPASRLTMDQVLYELEDFLGGHSAVANLLIRALIEIAAVPGLSKKMYNQCIQMANTNYMQALIHETLRKCSSPIVPHVASADSDIDGYPVKKGTMVMLNNYELNMSSKLWKNPEAFIPERFLTDLGTFRKPENFLPFSSGKRACMGYRLVEKVMKVLLDTIFTHFDIVATENQTDLPVSCLAVHPDLEMKFRLIPRKIE